MIDQGFIRSNNHHLPVVAYIYTIWKDDFGHSKSNFLHFYVYRCDNLLSKTDADGYVTRYSYTALDLVQKINYNRAKGGSCQYNEVGELVRRWMTGTASTPSIGSAGPPPEDDRPQGKCGCL
jgi:YD repeat-containing protein